MRFHVDVEGSGPTVVLGHGFAGSARNFLPQARALAPRYRVVRWDARGHARSEAPKGLGAYTLAAFVEDVGRVLDRVGAARAVVGGLSMGASVALAFALAHPERVQALVLAAFPPGRTVTGSFAAVARRFADAIDQRGLEAAGGAFVWGPASGLDPAGAALVRDGFLEHPAHGLVGTLRTFLAEQASVAELAPRLAVVSQPTLVIVGARDRLSLEPSRALADALPHAHLAVIEGAGHIVNLAQPAAFNTELLGFLDGLALDRTPPG